MTDSEFRLSYLACREVLAKRLTEPAPGRLQLVAGPRQVGKTTLLLELADQVGSAALYSAADGPEAALPGHWERLWGRAEETAAAQGRAVVLLDEIHLLPGWAGLLKGVWDRNRRRRTPIHVVATGSSALHLAKGSRESLAGRFERLTLTHWSARALAEVFGLAGPEAVELHVRQGSYPGAFTLRGDAPRWSAYVRDAILEPAIGRDLLALAAVRRPALLRQLFFLAAASPAQIMSLQKLQGQLQDAGALETLASYLALLEEAFLVAALPKFAGSEGRRRAAPPKLVTLSNALVAVAAPAAGAAGPDDPATLGAWVENACLAHAWSAGQRVSYWREEPLEVDGVLEGSWGRWALEVKTGRFQPGDLRGLLEFTRRHPAFRPLVVCSEPGLAVAERAGVAAMTWQDFLLDGPGQGED
jgi:hypothetical protein